MTLAEFTLDDGTTILIDVPTVEDEGDFDRASKTGDLAIKARQSFSEALDGVRPVAQAVRNKLRGLDTDEVEVKFGLKLSADAGAIFTSLGGEASFEITLKWQSDKSGK